MADDSGSRLWPVHIKPKDDELLSSWLVRLAMSHGLKLHTFCSIALPLKQIWTRDIDKAPNTGLIGELSTILNEAAERAIRTKKEHIDLEILKKLGWQQPSHRKLKAPPKEVSVES